MGSSSCKDGASKSNDGVCDVNNMKQNMNTCNNNSASVCANCGKEGSSDEINNTCNKCKQVKYCNAACKKKHRHKHKKECEEHIRLAAKQAAKVHDIELFKQPPTKEDCPICFLRIPSLRSGWRYQSCCGKVMCCGCCYAPVYDNQGNEVAEKTCPLCRTPVPDSYYEGDKRLRKRVVELNDAFAMHNIGCYYRDGDYGYPQDYTEAFKLWKRAAKYGYAEANNDVGYAYMCGEAVEVDEKKALYYWELAAMKGDAVARYNLGAIEQRAGNMDRALKHFMIAAEGGNSETLEKVKELYTNGYATKDDYTKALQSYQVYLGEIKSDLRDKAAAAREEYRYY